MHDPGEDLGTALDATHTIRLALDAMWSAIDQLPDGAEATDAVREALRTISHWLRQAEETALRAQLLTKQYAILRPVSLTSPPDPEAMAEITAAARTLDRHGLIITD